MLLRGKQEVLYYTEKKLIEGNIALIQKVDKMYGAFRKLPLKLEVIASPITTQINNLSLTGEKKHISFIPNSQIVLLSDISIAMNTLS